MAPDGLLSRVLWFSSVRLILASSQRVPRGAQRHLLQLPELRKTCVRLVRRGEQDIGVEEQPLHLRGWRVRSRIGIEAQLFGVLFAPCGNRPDRWRCVAGTLPYARRVPLDWHDRSGANEDVLLLLGDHDTAFFDAQALAPLRGYNDRTAFPDSCRLHS